MSNKNYETSDILHVKKGDIEYLQFKRLNEYSDKLVHAITLRHGGVSKENYSSLSFSTKFQEELKNTQKNINLICSALNISADNICKAKLNHTNNILILDNENKDRYKYDVITDEVYDGYIVKDKNIGNYITTADCNPIIIYDPIKNIVANIHSGWRGTINKIYIDAIKILKNKFNCNYSDLIVCVGPSINKCCFSSEDKNFKQQFLDVWPNEKEYITTDKSGRFHIDLPYLIKCELEKSGVLPDNIVLSNICTCCNSEDFFSYRKSMQTTSKDCGRMATIVKII